MKLYGVLAENASRLVFLDYASSPEDACARAVQRFGGRDKVGTFRRASMGGSRRSDDGGSWLELSVYDVTDVLDRDPDPIPDDESLMVCMDEDRIVGWYVAEQL